MLPASVSLCHFDILVSLTRKKSSRIGFSEMKMPGRREGDEGREIEGLGEMEGRREGEMDMEGKWGRWRERRRER